MPDIYLFIYQLLTSNKIKKIQSQVENKLETQTRITSSNYFLNVTAKYPTHLQQKDI